MAERAVEVDAPAEELHEVIKERDELAAVLGRLQQLATAWQIAAEHDAVDEQYDAATLAQAGMWIEELLGH